MEGDALAVEAVEEDMDQAVVAVVEAESEHRGCMENPEAEKAVAGLDKAADSHQVLPGEGHQKDSHQEQADHSLQDRTKEDDSVHLQGQSKEESSG